MTRIGRKFIENDSSIVGEDVFYDKYIKPLQNNNIGICQNCFEKSASPNSNLCKDCDDATIDVNDDDLEELIKSIEE